MTYLVAQSIPLPEFLFWERSQCSVVYGDRNEQSWSAGKSLHISTECTWRHCSITVHPNNCKRSFIKAERSNYSNLVIPLSIFKSSIYFLFLPPRKQTLNFLFVSKRQHGCLDSSLTHNKTKAFKVSSGSEKRWGFDVSALHEYKTRWCDRHKQNKASARNLKVHAKPCTHFEHTFQTLSFLSGQNSLLEKKFLGKRILPLPKSFIKSLFPSHSSGCKGNYPNEVTYTKPADWPQALKNAINHKPAKSKR